MCDDDLMIFGCIIVLCLFVCLDKDLMVLVVVDFLLFDFLLLFLFIILGIWKYIDFFFCLDLGVRVFWWFGVNILGRIGFNFGVNDFFFLVLFMRIVYLIKVYIRIYSNC